MAEMELAALEADGLVHHWVQGPRDVVPLYAPIRFWEVRFDWQFCWFLETPDAIPGVSSEELAYKVNYTLNVHGLGWHRSGVHFSQIDTMDRAQIVLRFTDRPPPPFPDMTNFLGAYYYDPGIGKNVAQVTAGRGYFDTPSVFAYILGMELAGHGCFRMWDMYIPEHEPYPSGSMGGYEAAMKSWGFPSELEIESAKAWLQGKAIHVHSHNFTVPAGHVHKPTSGLIII